MGSRNRNAYFYRAYRPPLVVWLVSGRRKSSFMGGVDLGAGTVGFGTVKPGIVGEIFFCGLGMEEGGK